MGIPSRVFAICVLASSCGLERDYEAFLAASQSASGDNSSAGSSTSSTGPQTDTGTAGSSGDTGAGSTAVASADTSAGETSSASTDAPGDTSSESSSTGAPGFCGDGLLDPSEECDDGNLDETDRCTSTCEIIRLIFVTSVEIQGKIGGLVNADATCKSLAAKAMIANPGSRITNPSNFKALLATSTQTVFDRHFPGAGPYQLVNGLRVSDSFAQLFSEPHFNPINVDERSMSQSTGVWTGTTADGQSFPGIDFCNDWTSTLGTSSWGDTDYVNGYWLYIDIALGNPTIDCGDEFALYCLEQE